MNTEPDATLQEQLDRVSDLNAECRAAVIVGDTDRAWRLLGDSLATMRQILGMDARTGADDDQATRVKK